MTCSIPRRVLLLHSISAGVCLIACLMHTPADAQKPRPFVQPPTAFECRWTEGPIKIDGTGDEPAWQHAQAIDQFYLPWLGKDARWAKTATKAKLLWDREHLYFFADMEDSDLYANVTEHDGMTWDNDVFELFFKPAEDKPGYYEFQVNAAGTIMDMFLPRRGAGGYKRFVKDGDFHIDAKVKLRGTLNKWQDTDEGWSVEGKIPWSDFLRTGGRPQPGEKWKFALCRYDYSVAFEGPENSTCAPLKGKTFPDFHLFEDYATVKFMGPDGAKTTKGTNGFGLDKRVPLTSSKVFGFPDAPPPYRVKKVYAKATLDFPLWVEPIQGADTLLLIANESNSGAIVMYTMKDDPNAADKKLTLKLADTGYHFAFHPKFQDNGYLYVGSNGPPPGTKDKKRCRIVRYTMDRQTLAIDPQSALLIIDWESDGHNGAAVTFGHDGMLYITTGDGTSDSDTNLVGQNMSSLLAKVLRIEINVDLSLREGQAYSVPKDNPFINVPGARPEIWALGLRNPWRMTTDAKTGHIWVAQNGQDLYEQAFLVKKGDNYGWSVMEGNHPFYLQRQRGPNFYTKPTVEHHHSEARSLTGGIVYYGKKHPDLVGAYIYGDYSTGKIWAVKHDGAKVTWHKEIADTRLAVSGFGADSQGEILICDYQGGGKGGLFTLEKTPEVAATSGIFPKKLSDSGLFRSVQGHVMAPALIPYSVNAVLWSDGAAKMRWLGIPGDGTIEFTTNRGWNFPDETVIVKSFHIDMEEGNADSRRWIETRFLTKQGGQWYGYSYAWNDEQTEGTLVDAKGADRDFTLRTAAGPKKLSWHYPSRSECMVCHSRAANFVLGFTELQMNKEHDYGGIRDNQLRVFEQLGLLRVNYAEETRQRMREELKSKGKTDKEIDDYLEKQTATRGQREPEISSLLSFAPENYRKLVDPYDSKQDLTARARSYLHSNCAQCHVEAGGGNSQMELEFTTPLDKMRIIGVKPVHDTYGTQDAKLVAPGQPERSILLYRIAHRDKGHMPPLATRLVDLEAVKLMEEWIRNMK